MDLITEHLPCAGGRPWRYHGEQETQTVSARCVDNLIANENKVR